MQFDETGNRKRKYRYGDEDELELEQQERKRRQMLNKEFKLFSEKIAEAATSSVSTWRLLFLLSSDRTCTRPASRLSLTFLSASCHSRVSRSGRMSASSLQPSASCTCLTHPS